MINKPDFVKSLSRVISNVKEVNLTAEVPLPVELVVVVTGPAVVVAGAAVVVTGAFVVVAGALVVVAGALVVVVDGGGGGLGHPGSSNKNFFLSSLRSG
jgi:hypothetical protein